MEWISEETYRFRLSQFKTRLLNWLEKDPCVIEPRERWNEVMSFIKGHAELPDLSISRPMQRIKWGIPVPGDATQTIYVWFDALLSYLSTVSTLDATGSIVTTGPWPPSLQIIGKDILRFHAVYYPAILMAADLPLPTRLLCHSHWLSGDGTKMSKSRGNAIDPYIILTAFNKDIDVARFWLCRLGGLTKDRPWDWARVRHGYDKVLRGQLGNLIGRITSPKVNLERRFLPRHDIHVKPDRDGHLLEVIDSTKELYEQAMNQGHVGKSLEIVTDLLSETNKYVTRTEPWRLTTSTSADQDRTAVLHVVGNATRIASMLLQPVMPGKSQHLLDRLAVSKETRSWHHGVSPQHWNPSASTNLDTVNTDHVLFPPLTWKSSPLNA